jgi:hypothetical protein
MPKLARSMNDAFFIPPPLLRGERRTYTPGDVDREKVYATWCELYKQHGKEVPEDIHSLSQVASGYLEKSLPHIRSGKANIALAYAYFGSLLGLRTAMLLSHVEHELKMREYLRIIERQLCEEQLLPKLLTTK